MWSWMGRGLPRGVSVAMKRSFSEVASPQHPLNPKTPLAAGEKLKYLYRHFREPYSRHRVLVTLSDSERPNISQEAFIASDATIVGDVHVQQNASIWFGAVLRGDRNSISIGAFSNVQDGVVISSSKDRETVIGDRVTIGHEAILGACVCENNSFIGMGAVIGDGAVIGTSAMVAANAVVPPGTTVPPKSLWIGDRVARTLSYGEVEALEESAAHYAYLAERFVSGQLPSSLLHVEVEKIRQAIGEPNVSLPSEKCSI